MSNVEALWLFLLTLGVFSIFDLVWLGVIAKDFYHKQIGRFMKEMKLPRIALTYLVIALGLAFFAVIPAVNEESLGIAMGRGLAFGFFSYAIYDLTNWTTIDKWPTKLVVVDII